MAEITNRIPQSDRGFNNGTDFSQTEITKEVCNADPIDKSILSSDLTQAGSADEKKDITILHTNDMHAQVEPHNPETMIMETDSVKQKGGFTYLSSAVNEIRDKNPDGTLLLDAGDLLTGSPLADLNNSEPMVSCMNEMGYDAMTIGNHDFFQKLELLKEREEKAEFPFLSANLVDGAGGKNPIQAESYIIRDINGLNVGIFGLTKENSSASLDFQERKLIELEPAADTAEKIIPEMRKDGADVIVALTHLGIDGDRKLAEEVDDIDVIVGGHTHTELKQHETVNDTIIVQAGEHQNNLGVLNLEIITNEDGIKINNAESALVPIDGKSFQRDPVIDDIIDDYKDKLEPYLQEVIGKTDVGLECLNHNVCDRETNLANFVTDTVREHTGADICLMSPVYFSQPVEAGEVKTEHLHVMHPWYDNMSTVKMTGETIMDIAEKGVARDVLGVSPSGIRIKYDSQKEPGERLLEVSTNDGSIIDPEKEYTVVTKDFLLDSSEYSGEYKNYSDRKPVKESIYEILIDRFKSGKKISPETDERIFDVSSEKRA
jgi:2',3'-cyclic-nucleotide 2'-phosphodiesterase (5'-nucleotidase family)